MLYVMMLAAPYLVRTRGHATVETLTQLLPRPARRTVETIACAASVAISLVLAYYGLALGIESIERGELDIRSVAVPKWVVFAPLPPCFILTAAEFLRILLRREALTGGDPLAKETL